MDSMPSIKIPAMILREHYDMVFRKIARKFPEHKEAFESFRQDELRMYEPWPDWVLRVATEIISVNCPRVDKQMIFGCLNFFHAVCFGLPIETSKISTKTITTINENLIRLVGHQEAHRQIKFAEAEVKLEKSPEFAALKTEW
ncbi:MAG: hypothetical protein ACREFE_15345, partial [Limisphaerales bacterium]